MTEVDWDLFDDLIPPKRSMLKYHRHSPVEGFIFIHDALNKIGMKKFKDSWGVGPAWHLFPFEFPTEKLLKSNRKGGTVIQKTRFLLRDKAITFQKTTDVAITDLRAAHREVSAASDELLKAIREGSVPAYHMTDGHQLERIPAKSLYWKTQRRMMFGAGMVSARAQGGLAGYWEVMLARPKFDAWLYPKKASRSKFDTLEPALAVNLTQELEQFSRRHGNLRFSEKALLELMREALGNRFRESALRTEILERLAPETRQRRGPPHKDHRQAFDASRPSLLAQLRKVVEAWQG
jgi:hypothetical protein